MQRKYAPDGTYIPKYNTAGYMAFGYVTRSIAYHNTARCCSIKKFSISEFDYPIDEMPVRLNCYFSNKESLTLFIEMLGNPGLHEPINWDECKSENIYHYRTKLSDLSTIRRCLQALNKIDEFDENTIEELNKICGFQVESNRNDKRNSY